MVDTLMTNAENEVSLTGCMQDVPDPRAPYNPKHKFFDIIIIAVTAVLSGIEGTGGNRSLYIRSNGTRGNNNIRFLFHIQP